ncbi:MAG: GH1 family beta-glucosidase [Oscillospiraceae bacterium]|nr:GH1 family beta-glucosidase [Oscillospiraceae bacterium]
MPKYEFPKDFKWGTATASYQIEGAVKQDGRTESIWDRFCQMPGNILRGDTGEVANDHYNRYKEDVALMKELGHTAYRFSVSWSRVLPDGVGKVNEKGLQFYSDLVDELISAGIEPFLTLYHWDLPQVLQDKGGWQNSDCVKWFEEYSKVLFDKLGGRVKYWSTLNEPFCVAFVGNFFGEHAPGIRDLGASILVSYNLMLAHAASVRLFREMKIPGEMGITLNFTPSYPYTDSEEDKLASRYNDGFAVRWFMDAIFNGSFPQDMLDLFKERGITLPDFADIASVAEDIDFLGVNYYHPAWHRYNEHSWPFYADNIRQDIAHTDRDWAIHEETLEKLLIRLKNEYNTPKMYITENGCSYNDAVTEDGEVLDYSRINYLTRHFKAVHRAIEKGVDIRGYMVWSFYDNFEWAFGRYSRFGIVHHDFDTLKRTPKQSAYWMRDVIKNNGLD